ncbi:MAG: hypothetical protein KBH11_13305 [Bacteroidia bacterium]|nr:hypothetical protein [Bacteroidia bacterium]
MKNFLLLVLAFCLVFQLSAQMYESKFGYSTDPSGTYRVLIIFAEIDYTSTCDPDPYPYNPEWLVGELPAFKDDLLDIEPLTNPVNYISKYFHEMSFGNLTVVGDYYPEIITINCSDAISGSLGGTSNVTDYLDNLTSAIVTENGYELSDFDAWTNTSPGVSKTNTGDGLLDAVAIIWRNNTYIDGNPIDTDAPCGSGYAFADFVATYPIQTMTDCSLLASFGACVESDAFGMIIAEYFHTLFGGNNLVSAGFLLPLKK